MKLFNDPERQIKMAFYAGYQNNGVIDCKACDKAWETYKKSTDLQRKFESLVEEESKLLDEIYEDFVGDNAYYFSRGGGKWIN